MTRIPTLVLLTTSLIGGSAMAQNTKSPSTGDPKPVQQTRTSPTQRVPASTLPQSDRSVSERSSVIGRSEAPVPAELVDERTPSNDVAAPFTDPERQDLPYVHESRALGVGATGFSVFLTEQRYRPLSEKEVQALPGLDRDWNEPFVRQRLSWYRKVPHALVDIYPYRFNAQRGAWERLVSYTLEVVEQRSGGGGGVAKSYPSTSRLSSGEWYRVQVLQDGVHAIPFEVLNGLGLAGPVPSDQVNVYGGHYGMLPFLNDIARPTDLPLNATIMEDGGDGEFGPGDRILFYASGPHAWDLNTGAGRFTHTKHVFTDTASYFVGIGVDPAQRVQQLSEVTDPATRTSTSFDDRQFIERDLSNLLKSGREFMGETYDLTTTYNYNFSTPYLRSQDPVTLEVDVFSRTFGLNNASSWRIQVGSAMDSTFAVQGISGSYTGDFARPKRQNYTFNASGNNLPITVTFLKNDPVTSIGYMNFLRVNLRRDLKLAGNSLIFRDLTSVGPGEITEFTLDLAQGSLRIWDVTDPYNTAAVPFTDNNLQKVFRVRTDSLRQFVAFKPAGIPEVIPREKVQVQDLHATALPADLVIVCPQLFWSECQRLAAQRASEGLSVVMVTPQQVFNEFSSGMRDATAIKRYMKMLYDRAGQDQALLPRYLLLFGDGSYNNLSIAPGNQNYIPSYQTSNAHNASSSYCSDDYFGLLDDNEGEYQGDLVDIGIGRIPVSSTQIAREMVDKILNYDRLLLLQSGDAQVCSVTGDGGSNDWRTNIVFASDDQEGDGFEGTIHMSQSNSIAVSVEQEQPCMNVAKIYLDAYQQYSTPGGERYPDAQDELRDRVQKGALIVNYIGHGGEVGWAHERFLDNSTILGWTNKERLPLFMTATCEFTRWDDPARTSAGEYVMLNPDGAGIGLMTTTRIAYSNQNFALSQFFYDHIFEVVDEQGRPACLGDVFRRTKLDITSSQPTQVNHRNFALIGDPSLRLALPKDRVEILSVTDTAGTAVDTLKALSTVRITGRIVDTGGQPITSMNGLVIPTVYDKSAPVSTLANDGGQPFNFNLRKNIIYRGKATVQNGEFSFTFVVPKDINYAVGPGRISCYAESFASNACGGSTDVLVGSTATDVVADELGPEMSIYMNDERFVRGGITNETPLLLVKLFDQNGINTLGNSIGHDLVAVLDENTDQAIVLNDLYESDLDTYQSGKVRYRFGELAEGEHTVSVKAWDVFNNSSTSSTEFVVAPSAELALEHVLNYPNPFTTYTEFFFEHNRPCSTLDVQVQVFSVSGRLVKTLNRQLNCNGFRSEPMAWDGRDDMGDKLGRGVYVYRVNVVTPEGDKAEKFEKLVILR
ncbi:MAG: type IX secretion system sortase PorU [Flavobacteriales bacterium]|nr:type IX secretion system sortase PorU [Flavobacteriales bacterium]